MNNTFAMAAAAACLFASVSVSAQDKPVDWTPVFKNWENGCDDSKMEDQLRKSLFVFSNGKVRLGKVVLPEPYRSAVGQPKLTNHGDYSTITLPVRGNYYGITIVEAGYYAGHENGINGKYLLLDTPIQNAKKSLRQVKFKRYEDTEGLGVDFIADISANKNKMRTNVVCDTSM